MWKAHGHGGNERQKRRQPLRNQRVVNEVSMEEFEKSQSESAEKFEKNQAESSGGFEKWKAEVGEEIRKMEPEDRLKLVSESIRAMAEAIGVGISFCVIDPGFGITEDKRLAANYIAEQKDRPGVDYFLEAGGNLSCMMECFMSSLRKLEIPDGKILGLINAIVKDAKNNFAWTDPTENEE